MKVYIIMIKRDANSAFELAQVFDNVDAANEHINSIRHLWVTYKICPRYIQISETKKEK